MFNAKINSFFSRCAVMALMAVTALTLCASLPRSDTLSSQLAKVTSEDVRSLPVVKQDDGAASSDHCDPAPLRETITQSGTNALTNFSSCPFRHRTRYYDSETWLYYYGYRYYDPSTTKWISKDPLGEEGGWNLTCFCDNDPVNGYDPLGLDPYSVINETSSVSMSFATLFPPPPREFFITADDRSTIGYEMERDIRGIPVYRLKSTGYSATSLFELRRTAASLGKNVVTPLPPENAELGTLKMYHYSIGEFSEYARINKQQADQLTLNIFFTLETAGGFANLTKSLGRLGVNVLDDVAPKKHLYIGKNADLRGVPRNQTLIPELSPDLGSPKANYYRNMSKLRGKLREGYDVIDASKFRKLTDPDPTDSWPDRTVRQSFLGAERNLMENRGFNLNLETGLYE